MAVGDRLEDVTAILVLGAGLVALAMGFGWYWWVWVVGFVVVVPLVDEAVAPLVNALADRGDDEGASADASEDALDRLRERYARGELSDAAFERKVEKLVGTETPEDARRAVGGDADESAASEPERERE